jgi:hypothetical protein
MTGVRWQRCGQSSRVNAATDAMFDHVPTDEQIIISAYETLAQRHANSRSRDRCGGELSRF